MAKSAAQSLGDQFRSIFDDELSKRRLTASPGLDQTVDDITKSAEREVSKQPSELPRAISDWVRFIDQMEESAGRRDSRQLNEQDYRNAKAACGKWPWCYI